MYLRHKQLSLPPPHWKWSSHPHDSPSCNSGKTPDAISTENILSWENANLVEQSWILYSHRPTYKPPLYFVHYETGVFQQSIKNAFPPCTQTIWFSWRLGRAGFLRHSCFSDTERHRFSAHALAWHIAETFDTETQCVEWQTYDGIEMEMLWNSCKEVVKYFVLPAPPQRFWMCAGLWCMQSGNLK